MAKALTNELPLPPSASSPGAWEVLRLWAQPNGPQQFTIQPTWEDPAAWGVLLADLSRQIAKAYAVGGMPEADALKRIVQLFNAEVADPTGSQLSN